MRLDKYTRIYMYVQTCRDVKAHVYVSVYIYTYTRTHIYICTCIYINICIHAYTRAHTRTPVSLQMDPFVPEEDEASPRWSCHDSQSSASAQIKESKYQDLLGSS